MPGVWAPVMNPVEWNTNQTYYHPDTFLMCSESVQKIHLFLSKENGVHLEEAERH